MYKQSFIDRVIREGCVDTRRYRYRAKFGTFYPGGILQYAIIERLPLSALDTTEAISGWERIGNLHVV